MSSLEWGGRLLSTGVRVCHPLLLQFIHHRCVLLWLLQVFSSDDNRFGSEDLMLAVAAFFILGRCGDFSAPTASGGGTCAVISVLGDCVFDTGEYLNDSGCSKNAFNACSPLCECVLQCVDQTWDNRCTFCQVTAMSLPGLSLQGVQQHAPQEIPLWHRDPPEPDTELTGGVHVHHGVDRLCQETDQVQSQGGSMWAVQAHVMRLPPHEPQSEALSLHILF